MQQRLLYCVRSPGDEAVLEKLTYNALDQEALRKNYKEPVSLQLQTAVKVNNNCKLGLGDDNVMQLLKTNDTNNTVAGYQGFGDGYIDCVTNNSEDTITFTYAPGDENQRAECLDTVAGKGINKCKTDSSFFSSATPWVYKFLKPKFPNSKPTSGIKNNPSSANMFSDDKFLSSSSESWWILLSWTQTFWPPTQVLPISFCFG